MQVVQDSLNLLLSTMREWAALCALESCSDLSAAPQDLSTMSWVEGCVLGLLCSSSVKIRRLAMAIASQVRTLHSELGRKHQTSLSRSNSMQWSEPESAASQQRRAVTAGSPAFAFIADVIDRCVC